MQRLQKNITGCILALLLKSGLDLSEEDDGKGRQDRQLHKHLEQIQSQKMSQAEQLSSNGKPDTFTRGWSVSGSDGAIFLPVLKVVDALPGEAVAIAQYVLR